MLFKVKINETFVAVSSNKVRYAFMYGDIVEVYGVVESGFVVYQPSKSGFSIIPFDKCIPA